MLWRAAYAKQLRRSQTFEALLFAKLRLVDLLLELRLANSAARQDGRGISRGKRRRAALTDRLHSS